MSTTTEIVLSVFLVAGALLAFIGSWGLAKLNDFYMRLHGPTKASTLGLGGMLTASAIYFTATADVFSLHEVLITIFLFITAPVSAHLLAKTAMHKRFEFVGDYPDPLDHPLNIGTQQSVDLSGMDEEDLPEEEEGEEYYLDDKDGEYRSVRDVEKLDEEALVDTAVEDEEDAAEAEDEEDEGDEGSGDEAQSHAEQTRDSRPATRDPSEDEETEEDTPDDDQEDESDEDGSPEAGDDEESDEADDADDKDSAKK